MNWKDVYLAKIGKIVVGEKSVTDSINSVLRPLQEITGKAAIDYDPDTHEIKFPDCTITTNIEGNRIHFNKRPKTDSGRSFSLDVHYYKPKCSIEKDSKEYETLYLAFDAAIGTLLINR